MKKVYTIEITNAHINIWYFKRVGDRFDVELSVNDTGHPMFKVIGNSNLFIKPINCRVIEERIEKISY